MPTYRICSVDEVRRMTGPPTLVTCQSDDEAVALARKSRTGDAVELWRENDLIYSAPAEDRSWRGLFRRLRLRRFAGRRRP